MKSWHKSGKTRENYGKRKVSLADSEDIKETDDEDVIHALSLMKNNKKEGSKGYDILR